MKMWKPVFKTFFAIVLSSFVLFSFSCSKKSQQNTGMYSDTVPNWYLNPKKGDSIYLYGVGDGSNLSSALKDALNDAASKLRTDISSTTTTNTVANNDFVSNSLQKQITASVEKITFNNYETTQSIVVGSKIYTEVRIDRQKMIEEKHTELDNIKAKISYINQNAGSFANILEKRLEYKKTFELLPKLKSLSYLLYALEGSGFDLRGNLELASNFENQYNKLMSSIIFKIDDCEAKDAIRQILNSSGLKTSNNTDGFAKANVVEVNCKVSLTKNEIYSQYYTKGEVIISLEADGKQLVSKIINFTGSSALSQSEATKNAFQNLSDGNVLGDNQSSPQSSQSTANAAAIILGL